MTNKERLKKAFSALHTSDDFVLDLEDKTMKNKYGFRKAAIAACAALAVCAGGVTCYAANVGGIQRTVQVWLNGDQTDAVITVDEKDGIAQYNVKDKNGKDIQNGGGVAIEDDGSERPLTADEIENHLNNSPTTETINGHKYLFYKDQKVDLTGKFNKDGLCFVTFKDGDKNLYVTVSKNGGLSSSDKRYVEKKELPDEWFK